MRKFRPLLSKQFSQVISFSRTIDADFENFNEWQISRGRFRVDTVANQDVHTIASSQENEFLGEARLADARFSADHDKLFMSRDGIRQARA